MGNCQRLRNFGSPNFLVKSMKIHDGYPIMDLEEKTLTL